MKIHLYLLMALLGVVLTVHLAMNAKVGMALGNARVANAVFWCIGAVMAVIIGLTGWKAGGLDGLKQVSPIMLTAGAMGACLVFGIAWLFPQLGAGKGMIVLISGQVIAGLVLSQFGWLGSPKEPITMLQTAGAVVMVGGATMTIFGR